MRIDGLGKEKEFAPVKERKSILFITNRVPFPPDKGDRIRTFHEIDHLVKSHDVYCACFTHSRREAGSAVALKRWCKDVIAIPWRKTTAAIRAASGWMRGKALTESAYASHDMTRRLRRWSDQIDFDAVIAFSSMMAPYALEVPARRRILDLCDVDSEKWLDYARETRFPASALWRTEGMRVRQLERRCFDAFDATVVITERERQLLEPFADAEQVHVVSNGVRIDAGRIPVSTGCAAVIGFLGTMDYAPNVQGVCWFAKHVWPLVRKELPFARFMIIGRNPTRAVRKLASLPGVIVTGEVADARRYLARCRVVVAPLKIARGIPNKVLEAMAAKRPVVATSAVAATIEAEPEREIIVADDPIEMAEKVVGLSWHDGKCEKIGAAGQQFVMSRHRWEDSMRRFEEIVFDRSASGRQKMPSRGLAHPNSELAMPKSGIGRPRVLEVLPSSHLQREELCDPT
jgi:polysaccharide biosynthesis protein PslH